MTIVISTFPAGLPERRTQSHALAVAETARQLAGRSRLLYELATGVSGEANASPAIPKNPQGRYGIDHSGAPYGVAIRHPIATGTGVSRLTSQWIQGQDTTYTANKIYARDIEIWVRPHAPGPYSLTTWRVRAESTSGANVATEIRVTDDAGFVTSTTVVISSDSIEIGPEISLRSGWNTFRIELIPEGSVELGTWTCDQDVQVRDF